MTDCDGMKCFLFDGCPGRTGVCYSCGPDGNECPVYRWFQKKILKKQPEQKFFVDSDGKITPLPIQPQWISVEDKLPYKSDRYLVYFGKGIGIRMKTAFWLSKKRIWKGAEAYSTLNGITHWMPLPEPPEEVKQ